MTNFEAKAPGGYEIEATRGHVSIANYMDDSSGATSLSAMEAITLGALIAQAGAAALNSDTGPRIGG